MALKAQDLRNLALLGHGGAGKTSLVDAMAFLSQVSPRHGKTSDGSSVSDTEPEERERQQSLTSHIFHMPWKGKTIQLMDTPGHPDFLADTLSSLRAVETIAFVVDAPTGVTFNTRRLWAEAERSGNGKMILLTKLDAENVDVAALLEDITQCFGDKVVPITLPEQTGPGFAKVSRSITGDGLEGDATERRAVLEERVAEADDELMEAYFENGSLSNDDLDKYLPVAIAKGTVVPLLSVGGPSLVGISELLDFIADYCPSPLHAPCRKAAGSEEGEYDIDIAPDPSGSFVGQVFKVVSDPFVGKLSFIRAVRGSLKAEAGFDLVRTGTHEKVGGFLKIQGKDSSNLDEVVTGSIYAVAKLESLQIGDSLTTAGEKLYLTPIEFPAPMVAVSVTPKSRSDEQKIGPSLEKLHAEDPTFHIVRDADTHELVVEGLSSLHLDVMFAKLLRRYKVDVDRHEPTVPYRETVTVATQGHHRHKKQTGGKGQFGEVYLKLRPKDRGEGFEFIDSIVGGAIPKNFLPEIKKGIVNMMRQGPIAGFQVVDFEVEIYDGKFHDVDSDQISFQLAGGRAFLDAFDKARPILLEPMMNLDIHVPSRFTGDISSNLANQRARMTGMDAQGDDQIIRCTMPLKEARGYQSQLRSITAGEGSFNMVFSHFDPVPGNIQQDIVAQRKKKKEE